MKKSHKALLALTIIALCVGIANGVLDIYVKAAQTFTASAVTPYGEKVSVRIEGDTGRPLGPIHGMARRVWTLAWRVSGTQVSTVTNAVTITVTGSNIASTATVDYYIKAVSDSDPSKWTKTLEKTGASVTVGGQLQNTTGSVDINTHLQDLGVSTTQDQTVKYYVYVKVTATGLISGDTLTAEVAETLFDTVTYDYGGEDTTTLTPVADASVLENFPGTNWGDVTDLYASSATGDIRRALLRFDLTGISGVTSATLKLYKHNGNSGPWTRTYVARRITESWSEGTVTWNSKPGYTTEDEASATVTEAFGWYSWDVTGITQDWTGGSNYGLYVMDSDEGSSTSHISLFRSREYETDTSLRPKLEVTYVDWSASWSWWRLPPLSITAIPAGQQLLACIAAVIAGAIAINAIKRRKKRRRR